MNPPTTRKAAEKLTAELAGKSAALATITAERDQAIFKIQEDASPHITRIGKELTDGRTALEAWAQANRDTEFEGKLSLEFPNGVLSYRLGNRTLGTLPKWTWARVLGAMTAGRFEKFIRIKAEPNKAALLAATSGETAELSEAELKKIGLTVYQEENFSVELRACPDTLKGQV